MELTVRNISSAALGLKFRAGKNKTLSIQLTFKEISFSLKTL